MLCYLEGIAREDVAQRLGCPLGTLKGRLERGKELLRAALGRRGLSLTVALAAALVGRENAKGAVPALLLQMTLRAAVLTTPVAGWMKWKVAIAFLITISVVGASFVGWSESPSQSPVRERQDDPPVAHALNSENPTKIDALGDPLPEGAIARLGTLRFKHGGYIRSVFFTPDGKQLVSFANSDGIRIWDAATCREIDHLAPEAGGWIGGALLCPGGKRSSYACRVAELHCCPAAGIYDSRGLRKARHPASERQRQG